MADLCLLHYLSSSFIDIILSFFLDARNHLNGEINQFLEKIYKQIKFNKPTTNYNQA